MTEYQLAKLMAENPSYIMSRRLEDGSVAVFGRLMFTHAIYLGVTVDCSFTTRRFCYADITLGMGAFLDLKTKFDIPPPDWVAYRGLPV